MSQWVPIGMPDDVAYRLKALDKQRVRWPVLHLLIALGIVAVTYISVTHASGK